MEKIYLICVPVEGTESFQVVNKVVWDEATPWAPPADHLLVVKLGDEDIGWTFANGEWTAPPAPPPSEPEGDQP